MNEAQREPSSGCARLPPAPASLANSGGLFLGAALSFRSRAAGHCALWRPGAQGRPDAHAAGGAAQRAHPAGARRAPGETVGYSRDLASAKRPSRIATIAAGYADGFPRALSGADRPGGRRRYIGDYPVPIVGRVSMDFITVDVTGRRPAAGSAATGSR